MRVNAGLILALICLPLAAATAAPAFPSGEAWSYLLAQCEMGPRNPGSPGHARCAAWLADSLRAWGYVVEEHRFAMADPYSDATLELVNLRAHRPEWPEPGLVLAAHWDTRPWAEKDPDPARREEPILGANDGGSGVAVLLALARLCAERPPPQPVEFLFFDGEDYGKPGDLQHYLLGSRRFVRDHPEYRPELLILLDLVGGKRLRVPMEGYSLRGAPGPLARLFRLAGELDLGAFQPRPGPEVYDDHLPFLERGIPALNLVDLSYAEWHTHADRPEACSRASLAQVGTLLVHYLYEP
jgi:hypothetical protein